MIGRAYLWGWPPNGQAGVENVLDILRSGNRLPRCSGWAALGTASSRARTSSSRPDFERRLGAGDLADRRHERLRLPRLTRSLAISVSPNGLAFGLQGRFRD